MVEPAGLVWLLILCTGLVRLGLGAAIGLGVDESYMVSAGRGLRLGYFDHPPVSWWMSGGVVWLVGSEAAWVVRLPFVAAFAGSTWVMARLTAGMFGAWAGVWAAVAFNVAPVFGVTTGGWVLPDGPMVLGLLAAVFCLVRGVERGGWGWWLGAGAAAGGAVLSKYSAAVVLTGGVVALATVPGWRGWWRRPEPYVAGVVAMVVFAPVVIWNASNGWVSFAFQGGRAAVARFQPFGPVVVLAGAAGFLLPWVWAGLMAGLWRGMQGGPGQRFGWLMAWLAVGPIVVFAVVALWSRSVLFHWAMPGYLFLFPVLGAWLAEWRGARRWAVGSACLVAVGLGVGVSEVRWNWLGWVRPGLDPGLQAVDFTPLRGVLEARGLLGQAVAAPSWNDAGKVDYALGGRVDVVAMTEDARQFGFRARPALGADVLIVAPRQDEARIRGAYAGRFGSIEVLVPAEMVLPGRGVVMVPLFMGRGLISWP